MSSKCPHQGPGSERALKALVRAGLEHNLAKANPARKKNQASLHAVGGSNPGCFQAAAQTLTVLATVGPCYIQPGLAAQLGVLALESSACPMRVSS